MPPGVPKLGPEPVLLSRKEVDVLYDTLQSIIHALDILNVDYIVTGGSLLGAIRQHSILFCDDDIDISILDCDGNGPGDGSAYKKVMDGLQELLGADFLYQIKPWEGGDRVRPKKSSNIFVDIFVIRYYESAHQLVDEVIGTKKNGDPQPSEYVQSILDKIQASSQSQLEPRPLEGFWHFATRKAVEMWPKEVYRTEELFPLDGSLKMGPVVNIKGPRMPVLLLKRAFGKDCFEVYYQSASHKQNTFESPLQEQTSKKKDLPPLVQAGGTWEGGCKAPLLDEHYLPMQPILKARRRMTGHNKDQLLAYIERQEKREGAWIHERKAVFGEKEPTLIGEERPRRTVYMDGVFDLFHVGHLNAVWQCAQLGNRVVIGVTGDDDASGYKRPPIINQDERVALVKSLRYVDAVVCPCPLIVTEEFMVEQGIDIVVHGFMNEQDRERQFEFFRLPIETGRFVEIEYHRGQSTTDIIKKILRGNSEPSIQEKSSNSKPQWFGASLAAALNFSATIPFDPFPLALRSIIEPHIEKARTKRTAALSAIQRTTGEQEYLKPFTRFMQSRLSKEGNFDFDTDAYDFRSCLIKLMPVTSSDTLETLHKTPGQKDHLLHALTLQHLSFQRIFDEFVRQVCAPRVASMFDCERMYYQAFPCIRCVQPGDFSIGPHSDVSYGHHPCSINFYVPLTRIGGSSSLFLESRPGSEDWHPIEGNYGTVKHFAGVCTHWTTENHTDATRVSLDFRVIPDLFYDALKCGGSVDGGQRDVYRESKGYYNCCRIERSARGDAVWVREGPMEKPDWRCGFPWTVKDWTKISTR